MNRQRNVWDRLTEILQAADEARPAREWICQACPDLVRVSGAAISVRGGDAVPSTAYASDATVQRIEDLQLMTGSGPCVTAVDEGQPVLVPDLAARGETRWPGFSTDALAAGAKALFAFPLQVGSVRVGALDMYRQDAGPLEGQELADAFVVADAATVALLDKQAARPAGELDHYWWDLDSFYRVEVHQATGMVMAQLETDAAGALTRLRAYAFAEERPISEVARDVVARRIRLDGDTN